MFPMKEILLSIIMPSFNQAAYLERALLSVIGQKADDIEFIVIDGGSNDGSVEIIKNYATGIDSWVSEPDRGQSHAFNKGFKQAKGYYLTWVNSDDVLLDGAVDALRDFAKRGTMPDWIAANSLWIDADDKILKATYNSGWSGYAHRHGQLSVTGPSSIFSKALLERAGWLKEDYRYSMDTELWYRFASLGVRYKVLDHFFWALRIHAEAKVSGKDFTGDSKVLEQIYSETARTHQLYGVCPGGMMDPLLSKCVRLKRFAKIKSFLVTKFQRGRRLPCPCYK